MDLSEVYRMLGRKEVNRLQADQLDSHQQQPGATGDMFYGQSYILYSSRKSLCELQVCKTVEGEFTYIA